MPGPGRPSLYTQELADTICERLALGESLNKICRDDEMPGLQTVHDWLNRHEAFSVQYSRAREIQADMLADEVLDRVRNVGNEEAAGARVHLDGVKWFAGIVAPRKYTPKTQQQITGADGGALSVTWQPAVES